jgi:hypothetical protein
MRNVLMLIVGLLMIVVGAIIMIWNLAGENSATMGIVFGGVGVLFVGVSATIKKQE